MGYPTMLINFGIGEISLIVFVVLLLFGASRLPLLARSIANSIKEFKKAKDSDGEDESTNVNS